MQGEDDRINFTLANGRMKNKDCDKTLKELGVKNNDTC
jgi:hypothetical protein